jgi:hypothetical protein
MSNVSVSGDKHSEIEATFVLKNFILDSLTICLKRDVTNKSSERQPLTLKGIEK